MHVILEFNRATILGNRSVTRIIDVSFCLIFILHSTLIYSFTCTNCSFVLDVY